jgi:hypothetical protein
LVEDLKKHNTYLVISLNGSFWLQLPVVRAQVNDRIIFVGSQTYTNLESRATVVTQKLVVYPQIAPKTLLCKFISQIQVCRMTRRLGPRAKPVLRY